MLYVIYLSKKNQTMGDSAKLINSGDDSVITLNNSSFSIGRSLSCDHIIESLGISRFHCIIKKVNNKWILFDRSTNGTFVNTTLYKFNECVELKDGDVIKMGPNPNPNYVFVTSKDILENMSTEISDPKQKTSFTPSPVFPNDEALLEEEAAKLADCVEEGLTEMASTQPETSNQPPNETTSGDQNLDVMENELTCSICSELFIKAVTLNCSHTYCKFCIEEWRKNKKTCPICRKLITIVAPTLVLDNFIEKIITMQGDEVKETRKALIQQRQDAVATTAAGSSTSDASASVIEIFSGDEGDEDDDEDDSEYSYSDDHDYDIYDCFFDSRSSAQGRRGNYYGGYGRCFICNQTGHWANSCPFKRH